MRKQYTEIRWHGRGGQGIKTAAFMLAEALIDQGIEAQGFPMYGPEKSGAPVQSFNRISKSKNKIYSHESVKKPEIIVILDPSMLSTDDDYTNPKNRIWNEGLTKKTIIIANCDKKFPQENCPSKKIYTVDATTIARKNIKKPIPNTALMGILIKILKLDRSKLEKSFRNRLSKKLSADIVEGNIKCIKEGYNSVEL